MSLTPEAIKMLVTGEHGDPFAVLGPHASHDGNVIVRAFLPGAGEVAVVADGGAVLTHPLKPIHPDGLWEGEIGGRLPLAYRLRVTDATGHATDVEDPGLAISGSADRGAQATVERLDYRCVPEVPPPIAIDRHVGTLRYVDLRHIIREVRDQIVEAGT